MHNPLAARPAARIRAIAALALALVALTIALAAAPAANAEYTPTGPLVADTGFRPDPDGYSFENYGNQGGVKNLSAREMVKLFGREVCESPDGRCRLTTVARGWMREMNGSMGGGHCMGLAVTSELFHAGLGTPASPSLLGGSETVFGLPADPRVLRHIAYGFAFQALPVIQARTHNSLTARRLIELLPGALNDPDEVYTLGIFKKDHSGGHAITPFALEDRGNGRYVVLVYDNNYPGETRPIHVDVNANTWSYEGSPNPRIQSDLYDGDAKTSNLDLIPTTPALDQQDCFFCRSGSGSASDKLTLLWSGDPDTHEHGNLIVTDRRGRQAGCGDTEDGFRCRNQIPGVEQEQLMFGGEQVWLQSAIPSYRLPYGRPYTIALTGGELRKPAREGFALIGKGRYVGVADVKLSPGERDELHVSRGARQVIFENDPNQVETPRLQLGIETKKASYMFQLKARNVREGAAIGLALRPKARRVVVIGVDAKGTGRYRIKAVRSDHRGRTVRTRNVVLRSGEVVGFKYDALLRKRKPSRAPNRRG